MSLRLISTDFDGTIHLDHTDPPVPAAFEARIADLQRSGVQWCINTGRDLAGLLEGMARARMTVTPDWVVTVEREIHFREGARFVPLEPWSTECDRQHAALFRSLAGDLPGLFEWVNGRFKAAVFSDPWSPFCLIAQNNKDADTIEAFLLDYARGRDDLKVVRNDVYARFCHAAFTKGTALAEITRQLGLRSGNVLAAGDHFNDLPMLRGDVAHWLVAPANAIMPVRDAVRAHGGFISTRDGGTGTLEGIDWCCAALKAQQTS